MNDENLLYSLKCLDAYGITKKGFFKIFPKWLLLEIYETRLIVREQKDKINTNLSGKVVVTLKYEEISEVQQDIRLHLKFKSHLNEFELCPGGGPHGDEPPIDDSEVSSEDLIIYKEIRNYLYQKINGYKY